MERNGVTRTPCRLMESEWPYDRYRVSRSSSLGSLWHLSTVTVCNFSMTLLAPLAPCSCWTNVLFLSPV